MPADFELAAHTATELLLKQNYYHTHLDIQAIKHDKSIVFDSYSGFCRKSKATVSGLFSGGGIADGMTVRGLRGGSLQYIVLYNDNIRSKGRLRFTLAHELGHIMLGHEDDGADKESEANCFASHLLLPPVLTWEVLRRSGFKLSPQELAGIFSTSASAAVNRINSLRREQNPVFSLNEHKLLERFGGRLPEFDGPIIDY